MEARAHVGCLMEVRIIGVIQAEQTQDGKTETNDRLLGVAVHSYDHASLKSMSDVNPTLLKQVEEFFISYNRQHGKKFKVTGTSGYKTAIKVVKTGIQAYKSKKK